jgi:hypothetical protein
MLGNLSIQQSPVSLKQVAMAGAGALCAWLLCTCSFTWSTAHVTSAQLATGYRQGQALNPTNVFSPGDHVVHLVVVVANAPGDTRLGASWYAVDAGGSQERRLDSASATLNGENHIDLTLRSDANWPTGRYRVDLMLDGKLVRSLHYQVR